MTLDTKNDRKATGAGTRLTPEEVTKRKTISVQPARQATRSAIRRRVDKARLAAESLPRDAGNNAPGAPRAPGAALIGLVSAESAKGKGSPASSDATGLTRATRRENWHGTRRPLRGVPANTTAQAHPMSLR